MSAFPDIQADAAADLYRVLREHARTHGAAHAAEVAERFARGVRAPEQVKAATDREFEVSVLAVEARPIPTPPEVTHAPLGPGRPPYEEIQATGRTYGAHTDPNFPGAAVRAANPEGGVPVIGSTAQVSIDPPDMTALGRLFMGVGEVPLELPYFLREIERTMAGLDQLIRGSRLSAGEVRTLLRALDAQDTSLRQTIRECVAHERMAVPSSGDSGLRFYSTPEDTRQDELAKTIYLKLLDIAATNSPEAVPPAKMAAHARALAKAFFEARTAG